MNKSIIEQIIGSQLKYIFSLYFLTIAVFICMHYHFIHVNYNLHPIMFIEILCTRRPIAKININEHAPVYSRAGAKVLKTSQT